MQAHRMARRAVAACLCCSSSPPAAQAATDQEVRDAVTAGAAWIRTQQNPSTGALSGFGGDYALSALAAAGVHPADVGTPSAQDFYASQFAALTTPNSTAILFGHAAGIDTQRLSASTNLVARPGGRVQRERRARGLVRQRCDQPHGVQRAGAGAGGRAGRRAREGARRTCAGSSTPTAAGTSAASRPTRSGRRRQHGHDRRGTGGAVRDRRGRVGRGRTSGPVVPRRPPGPGDRSARQRRLDRLGGVGAERLRRADAGRTLHDVVRADAGGLPALPAGPKRRVPVLRRAEPLLDPEHRAGAGRRGVLR